MHQHLTVDGRPLPDPNTLDRAAAETELGGHVTELEALSAQGRGDSLRFKAVAERCELLDRRLEDIERMTPDRARLRAMVFGGAAALERGAFGNRGREHTATATARDAIALRSDESIAAWGRRTGRAPDLAAAEPMSMARLLRGMVHGDWTGADAEKRAIMESPASAGGHLIPTPLAGAIIDRARNASRVIEAGATVAPMTTQTLKYPRLLTPFVPDWRTENSPVNDKNLTFDSVLLTAKSLAGQVKISVELDDDSAFVPGVVEAEIAAGMGLEIDRVALRGSGADPEPHGVRGATGITTTTLATNGAQLANYDAILDAMQVLAAANYAATGVMLAPRTATGLAKLKEGGTNAYLPPPPGLPPFYVTNQVPTNTTTGTANNTSDIYVADWSKLVIGVRIASRMRLLTERYMDNMQVSVMCDFRGDVALLQPAAFVVVAGALP